MSLDRSSRLDSQIEILALVPKLDACASIAAETRQLLPQGSRHGTDQGYPLNRLNRRPRLGERIGLGQQRRGYVIQARLAGLPAVAMARWHYLPALLPSLIVVWTGMLARAVLGISALGFLVFGVQPLTPEWGTMLLHARVYIHPAHLQMIWPGLAVVLCVLSFNLAGDALRDALAKDTAAQCGLALKK